MPVGESNSQVAGTRLARRLSQIGAGMALLGVLALLYAAFAPMEVQIESPMAAARRVPQLPGGERDVEALIRKTAGRQLFRPAQALAAVKDTGEARMLLERLKLQGIVQVNDEPVAYVVVKDEGLKTVRVGDDVASLRVESIAFGKVTLTREGVSIELRQ